MTVHIANKATTAKLQYTSPSSTVDLSAYVKAVDLGNEAEVVDLGTFASPARMGVGRPATAATVTLFTDPAFLSTLAGKVGVEGTFEYGPEGTAVGKPKWTLACAITAVPLGAAEIGQPMEADLILAPAGEWTFGTF